MKFNRFYKILKLNQNANVLGDEIIHNEGPQCQMAYGCLWNRVPLKLSFSTLFIAYG